MPTPEEAIKTPFIFSNWQTSAFDTHQTSISQPVLPEPKVLPKLSSSAPKTVQMSWIFPHIVPKNKVISAPKII